MGALESVPSNCGLNNKCKGVPIYDGVIIPMALHAGMGTSLEGMRHVLREVLREGK